MCQTAICEIHIVVQKGCKPIPDTKAESSNNGKRHGTEAIAHISQEGNGEIEGYGGGICEGVDVELTIVEAALQDGGVEGEDGDGVTAEGG